ncbi:MAG: ribosome small subunit-dependent GTPase A [Oligoflexia bacterium]|nr:ribosome small subunit-dependent GTPase A [Oligoflexia bacterium]
MDNNSELKILAQIYRSSQRVFSCKIVDSNLLVEATALGLLLKRGDLVVGDYVYLKNEKDGENNYVIIERRERKSQIFRMNMREGVKRITAANIDLLVIVIAASKPAYKQGLLDRYLVRSYQWEIPTIVVFNKMDEYNNSKDKDESEFDIDFENDRLASLNIEGFEISAIDPSYAHKYLNKGLAELKDFIVGKSSLFLGASGVGKSKLIETLTNGEIKLKSGSVGKVGKGVHTTSWSEIVEYGDYKFFDSPGIRSFSLEDICKEDVINYFPDINEFISKCEFVNCKHDINSKGCAILSLLEGDNYLEKEKKIILTRLNSYLHILEEVSQTASWIKKNKFQK